MTPKLGKYNLIDQFGQGRIINPNMKDMGAKGIEVFWDSELMINQVNDSY